MKTKELIEQLQQCDGEKEVYVFQVDSEPTPITMIDNLPDRVDLNIPSFNSNTGDIFTIKKEVSKLQKEMIDEIWQYHKDILAGTKIKSKSDITTEFLDFDDEYCSLSWEMGYVYALQEVLKIINNK